MNLTITERLRRKIANLVPVGIRPMRLATGTLSITIDDFPKNAWENGRSIFERHDVKATFYVSGGLCEKNWLGLPQYDVPTLRAVHGSGHEIACHTFDHINCVRSSSQALGASIERNRTFVNDVLPDVALKNFAFPYGDLAYATKLRTAQRFVSCRGVRPGVNIGRVETSHLLAVGLEQRQMHLHDFPRLIKEAADSRGWLILFTHDISDQPSDYGCRPTDLEAVINMAKTAGLRIVPVKDVFSRFHQLLSILLFFC